MSHLRGSVGRRSRPPIDLLRLKPARRGEDHARPGTDVSARRGHRSPEVVAAAAVRRSVGGSGDLRLGARDRCPWPAELTIAVGRGRSGLVAAAVAVARAAARRARSGRRPRRRRGAAASRSPESSEPPELTRRAAASRRPDCCEPESDAPAEPGARPSRWNLPDHRRSGRLAGPALHRPRSVRRIFRRSAGVDRWSPPCRPVSPIAGGGRGAGRSTALGRGRGLLDLAVARSIASRGRSRIRPRATAAASTAPPFAPAPPSSAAEAPPPPFHRPRPPPRRWCPR